MRKDIETCVSITIAVLEGMFSVVFSPICI